MFRCCAENGRGDGNFRRSAKYDGEEARWHLVLISLRLEQFFSLGDSGTSRASLKVDGGMSSEHSQELAHFEASGCQDCYSLYNHPLPSRFTEFPSLATV